MNKALSASLALLMTLGLLLGGCSSVRPAEALSAPAITIEDQYQVDFGGYATLTVKTWCRNGDYLLASYGYREMSVQMIPELNGRCKD